MNPKSTLRLPFLLLFFISFSFESIAQQKFIANPVGKQAAVSLRSHFSEYSLFSINTSAITGFVQKQTNKHTSFELQLPGIADWKFSVVQHDLLSKDYTLTVNTAEGKTILPRPSCMTYTGYLSDVSDSRVTLTIDNDLIYGIVKSNGKEYFIEPLRYFNKQSASDVFVVYDTKDVNPDPSLTCGVKEFTQRNNSMQRLMSGTNCVQAQLAIASDVSMFTRYGSAGAVQTHNIGVINNVIWDYVNDQFNDNIEFVIVGQNVSTLAGADQLTPAYTGTNSNTILSNFVTWGEGGGFGFTYDIAEFWTTRDIDNDGAGGGSGTIGLAYVGAVCTPFRYHILEDFAGSNPSGSGWGLRVLTSHEIGHNFNCSHDAAGSGFIMAPSVSSTSTWSPASIASVNGFVPGLGCVSACSLAGKPIADFITTPEAICTGGTFQLTDHSLQGPTSWSWTMTGGTPASSTSRNPTVSYATTGMKTISLTSANGGGSSSPVSKQLLVSSSPAIACSNTGAGTSDAGIRSFSLNNIFKTSGGSLTDGNKYMDFTCTDKTSLVANTTYTVTADVGLANPPTFLFNLIQLYIDYNNDGDFADAGEAVYSSPSCYIGFISFTFTTPVTPPVTNQLLRARFIAKDCVGGVNSCYNVTDGQVEDYSVFFVAGTLLPVSLISFDGYRQNGYSILNWETANEKDNSHYIIERSLNGIDFESIGTVNGAVNSNTNSKYNFTDQLNGLANYDRIYYRLKIVSLSGNAEYSKTISLISSTTKNDWLLSIQPNPFVNTISATIQLKSADNIHVLLTDMSGRTIYRNEQKFAAGIHTFAYPGFDNLAKGAYLLKFTSSEGTVTRLVEKQ
jgi:PKD repeat protein